MFVQHTLRFTKQCHCGTKNKKARAIFLTKVNRRYTVYSWALKQDVGITGFSVLGVCVMRGEELKTVLFALAVIN